MPKVSPRHFLFMEIVDTGFCVKNLREHSAVRKMGALAFGYGGVQSDACAFVLHTCLRVVCAISRNLSA